MEEIDNQNESFNYVSYGLHKDLTRIGSIKLTQSIMKLVIFTFFDKMEHESTYTVTNPKHIEKFYKAIGCNPDENKLVIKKALRNRFPQPQLVKDFIDANKIEYKYTQSSKGIKRD